MSNPDPMPVGIVTRTARGSVPECAARLRQALEAKRLSVFAEFDHGAAAKAVGLELPDTRVVVFGSPSAGTPVMQVVRLAALDLPLKVLIYDDGGITTLAYLSPEALRERYAIPPALAVSLAGIDAIVQAATEG